MIAAASIVLAALLLFSAAQKIRGSPDVVATYARVGVAETRLKLLAAVLIAGAAGLLIGLAVPPLGVAATIGLSAYFAVAVAAHIRHRELANIATPIALFALSAVTLILHLLTR